MKEYRVLKDMLLGGLIYRPGDSVFLHPNDALILKVDGKIEEVVQETSKGRFRRR